MGQEEIVMDNYVKVKIRQLESEIEELKKSSTDEEFFLKRSEDKINSRTQAMKETKKKQFSTVALNGLYDKKDMLQFKSMILPVFSTTTGAPYDSLKDGELLLSYKTVNDPNKIYSRIDNTTIDHLAMKVAALEGKNVPELTQGLCTASGMAAVHTVRRVLWPGVRHHQGHGRRHRAGGAARHGLRHL